MFFAAKLWRELGHNQQIFIRGIKRHFFVDIIVELGQTKWAVNECEVEDNSMKFLCYIFYFMKK